MVNICELLQESSLSKSENWLIRFTQKGTELGVSSSGDANENGQTILGLQIEPKGNHIIYTMEQSKPYEFSQSRLTVRLIQHSGGIGGRSK